MGRGIVSAPGTTTAHLPPQVFPLCVAGNMLPIPIILFALRSTLVQKLMKPILDRAQAKAEASFKDPKTRAVRKKCDMAACEARIC